MCMYLGGNNYLYACRTFVIICCDHFKCVVEVRVVFLLSVYSLECADICILCTMLTSF